MLDIEAISRCLLYVGCVHGITSVLHARIKNRATCALICASVAILGASILMAYNEISDFPNYYKFLGVSRDSSVGAIRQAYRSASLQYHPDKNGGESTMSFQYARQAYDVLLDEVLRDRYNRFGPLHLTSDPRSDEVQLLCGMGLQYILWGIVVFCLTASKSTASARPWLYFMLMLGSVIEVMFTLSDVTLPSRLPFVEFEAIHYMHSCMLALSLIGCILARMYFQDVNKVMISVLHRMDQYFEMDVQHMSKIQEMLDGDDVSMEKVKKELVLLQNNSKMISAEVKAASGLLKIATERSNTNYFWIIIVAIYFIVSVFQ